MIYPNNYIELTERLWPKCTTAILEPPYMGRKGNTVNPAVEAMLIMVPPAPPSFLFICLRAFKVKDTTPCCKKKKQNETRYLTYD